MSCVTPQGKSVSFKVLTADVAAKFTKAAKFIEQSPAGYAALPSAALPQSIATSYADYVAGNAGTIGTQSLEQSAFADTPAVAVDANRGPLRGSSGAGFRQPASAAK